jgi:putative DNA methylase
MGTHRRLPHWYVEGKALFVTWCLHGAITGAKLPPPGKLSSGQAFVYMDRYLDTTRTGPMYLRQPKIAEIVVDTVKNGVPLGHYELFAYAVMPNHVHILIGPKIDPSRLLQSLKGSTARFANRALGLSGASFWQKESYDHWVRNEEEFERIRHYIEMNPVQAGLASSPEDYKWSSANHSTSPGVE